jgi:hypothetical protein
MNSKMNRRRIVVSGLAALCVWSALSPTATHAQPAPATVPSHGTKFVDDKKRFEVTIPEGWTKIPNQNEAIVLNIKAPQSNPQDTFAENLNVQVVDVGDGVTLDELIMDVHGKVSKVKFAGVDARQVDDVIEAGPGKQQRCRQTFALIKGTFFVITSAHAMQPDDVADKATQGFRDSWVFLIH